MSGQVALTTAPAEDDSATTHQPVTGGRVSHDEERGGTSRPVRPGALFGGFVSPPTSPQSHDTRRAADQLQEDDAAEPTVKPNRARPEGSPER